MIFGAILAGGLGTRLNIANIPKQFLMLGDRPIMIHTVEKFLLCNKFDSIYIGVHQKWISYTEDLLKKYNALSENVKIIAGGDDRNSTIMQIVSQIEADYGENAEHMIVTHDAVRPFVSLRIIDENINRLLEYDAVDTVISSTDTIVISENGRTITEIPNRNYMYQGQTPQSFRIDTLKKLYQRMNEKEKLNLTDACKIYVIHDMPVSLVQGEILNFKITTVEDYKMAVKLLEDGKP